MLIYYPKKLRCPYCGHEHDEESLDLDVNDFIGDSAVDMCCDHCEKQFRILGDINVHLTAQKVE